MSSLELSLLARNASRLEFFIGLATFPLPTTIEVWVTLVIASHAVSTCVGLRLDFVMISVTLVPRSLFLMLRGLSGIRTTHASTLRLNLLPLEGYFG